MELRQIQYFVALYEEGSVTRAARRLNVVQPAVSMQIAKLEEELGHSLFRRLPKGMIPTGAGRETYRHFVRILADLRAARDHLSALGDRVAGHVSVGVIASVANNALSDCLEAYCAKYPDVSLWVTGGYTLDLLEMVRQGSLDVAVVNQARRRINLPGTTIAREDLVLVGAPGKAWAARSPAKMAEIAAMKLVVPSRRHGLRGIIEEAANEVGVHLDPRLEFDELKTIEDFVIGSDHVTIMPPIAIHRSLERGALVSRTIEPNITRNVVAVHDPKRGLSEATTLFVDELSKAMARSVAAEAQSDL